MPSSKCSAAAIKKASSRQSNDSGSSPGFSNRAPHRNLFQYRSQMIKAGKNLPDRRSNTAFQETSVTPEISDSNGRSARNFRSQAGHEASGSPRMPSQQLPEGVASRCISICHGVRSENSYPALSNCSITRCNFPARVMRLFASMPSCHARREGSGSPGFASPRRTENSSSQYTE